MSLNLFESIITQIKEFKPLYGVCLHLGGEPLLHGNLEEMILIGKKNGIEFVLSTNGSLLNKERIRSLVDVGLGLVLITFSADRVKYEKACTGGNWNRIYNNIRNLVEYRDKARSSLKVIIKDLCLEKNIDALELEKSMDKLKKLFVGMKIDGFEKFDIHNWGGEFATRQDKSGTQIQKGDRSSCIQCSHLWFTINIKYDGRIVPCCQDIQGSDILGDANKDRIIDVWNSDRMIKMRRLHCQKQFEKIPLCRDCDRPWTGGRTGGNIPDMFRKYLRRKGILKNQSVI